MGICCNILGFRSITHSKPHLLTSLARSSGCSHYCFEVTDIRAHNIPAVVSSFIGFLCKLPFFPVLHSKYSYSSLPQCPDQCGSSNESLDKVSYQPFPSHEALPDNFIARSRKDLFYLSLPLTTEGSNLSSKALSPASFLSFTTRKQNTPGLYLCVLFLKGKHPLYIFVK